ncbi:MAG: hypothetical protein RLZZ246_1483 [Planctomycetota bacterium]
MKQSTPSMLILAGLAGPALAADTSWVGVSGASWSAPASWSAGVPGTQDTAVFSSAGPQRTVALGSTGGPILVDRVRLDKGSWRFTGARSLHAQAANAFSASIVAGTLANTSCFIDWSSSAELSATRLELATSSQAYAQLDISTGGIIVADDARIGLVGDGSLLLRAPSSFRSLELGSTAAASGLVARGLTGTGTVTGPADGLSVRDRCTVGKSGDGMLLLGTSCSLGSLVLGQNTGSFGSVTAHTVRVDGGITVGHGGRASMTLTGSASCAGPVVLAALGGQSLPPFDPDSEGSLLLDGGSLRCGGEFTAGLGLADLSIRNGGSLSSSWRIALPSQTEHSLSIRLSPGGTTEPVLNAPSISIAAPWSVIIEGTPAPTDVWLLTRQWLTTETPSILGDPGSGRTWRLVPCGGDLYLASAPIGEPDPELCGAAPTPVEVMDPELGTNRSFGVGGIAVGDGWYAIGCPGDGGSIDIIRRAGAGWVRGTKLTGPDGLVIGAAVAADGDVLASMNDTGTSVLVHRRSTAGWVLEQVIALEVEPGPAPITNALAVDGDRIAVGLPNATRDGVLTAGRVDIFVRGTAGWVLESSVEPAQFTTETRFGERVTIHGDLLAASDRGNGSATNHSILVARHSRDGWAFETSISGSLTKPIDLIDDALACTSGSPSTTSIWRPLDGVWYEASSAPPGLAAVCAQRQAIVSGPSLGFLVPGVQGLWSLDASATLPEGTVTAIRTSDALTVMLTADRSIVIDHAGPPYCPADLTGDGVVDGADLGLVLTAWGNSPLGDLTGDGITDGADLGLMLTAFGPCAP